MYAVWNGLSCLIACVCNAVCITPVIMPIFLYFFPEAGDWQHWWKFVLWSLFVTSLCGFIGLVLGLFPPTRPFIDRLKSQESAVYRIERRDRTSAELWQEWQEESLDPRAFPA